MLQESASSFKPIWSSGSAIGLLPCSPTPAGIHCPWMSREEWEAVYNWLYSSKVELMRKGVGRVAAWKARSHIPVAVEMTADLIECKLIEKEGKNMFQSLKLTLSMAITRFVNGVNELVKVRKKYVQGDIASNVLEYNVPSWLVGLRHCGTHELLPSLSALRSGVEFCLSWLRANYWEPQNLTIGEHYDSSREDSTSYSVMGGGGEGVRSEGGEGTVWRLTRGLCRTRYELFEFLNKSTTSDMVDLLKRKQLLQFPSNVKFDVETPEVSDITSFPDLSISNGDIAMWRTHLLKAAAKDTFKQRLVSAIIEVVNESSCPAELRDYLAAWLGKLLIEHFEVQVERNYGCAEIVHVAEEKDQFLPGGRLDWKVLLNVAKDHPGYYTYTIVTIIMEHLQSVLSSDVREKVLHLSNLVTLSSRIGSSSYIPGSRRGDYEREFEEVKTALEQRAAPSQPVKEEEEVIAQRWRPVSNMDDWANTPLGLHPHQAVSCTMFDIGVTENKQTGLPDQHESNQQPMDVHVASSTSSEPRFNISQIASQVTLF